MDFYRFGGPLLRLLAPEPAHNLTLWALGHSLAGQEVGPEDPILATRVWGRDFPNPLGLAAGFDKNAAVMGPLLGLGLGFVEVGSITPRPQRGNPKPRIFRLSEDGAVINRLGFNNQGLAAAARRLRAWRAEGDPGIVGINLGKNKDSADAAADYVAGCHALAPLADYLVINVSSPNTPGLRALQSRAALAELIAAVRAELAALPADVRPPLVLKIAPDLTAEDEADIAAVALEQQLDGITVSNTTIDRPDDLRGRHRTQGGGLSGQPLFQLSTAVLADIYRLTEGAIPLIGVGGIGSGAQAYGKLRAGASLLQLYTGLIYQGPGLIPRIKADLAELLRRDGFTAVDQAVGADHR